MSGYDEDTLQLLMAMVLAKFEAGAFSEACLEAVRRPGRWGSRTDVLAALHELTR